MGFDSEQVGQLRQIMRESLHEEPFREVLRQEVGKIVADAEERIVTRITTSVGEMIEDNILPQFDELREDIAEIKTDVSALKADVTELKQDVTGLKQDVAGLKSDVAVLQRDMTEVKYDVGSLKRDMTGMRSGRWQLAA